MRKCRHKNVTGRAWSSAYPRWYSSFRSRLGDATADALICDDCHAWLPLGPAPERESDRVERRAAEMADMDARPQENAQERDGWQFGWWLYEDELRGGGSLPDGTEYTAGYLEFYPGWPAGWLARHIVEHGKGER